MLVAHIPIRTRFPLLSVYIDMFQYINTVKRGLTQGLIIFPIEIRLTVCQSLKVSINECTFTYGDNITSLNEDVIHAGRDCSHTNAVRVAGSPGNLDRVNEWIANN
jgi:hypothetical protein